MNVDELIAELEMLSIEDLTTINDAACELVSHKRSWESKKILQKLEVGKRVKVNDSEKGDFYGTVVKISKTNAIIQEDGSFKKWSVPGEMISIGDNDGSG